MTRRLNVMIDDDAAALLPTLTTPHRQGSFISELIRAAAAARNATPAAAEASEQSAPPAPPDDPTEPIRMDAYQVATELNVLTNRLMEIAEQPTRAVWRTVTE